MSRPAFLVEGYLEQSFIKNVCSNCPVQRINCNGQCVSVESIAKRVGTLGRLLQRHYAPLVVVFDREGRDETAEELENAFVRTLNNEGLCVPVIVGIPDRDIENWILADFEVFAEAIGGRRPEVNQNFEGEKGKSVLKSYLVRRERYIERINGVAWLKSCRPSIMRNNSRSFAKFAEALAVIHCWWIDEQHLTRPNSAGTLPA